MDKSIQQTWVNGNSYITIKRWRSKGLQENDWIKSLVMPNSDPQTDFSICTSHSWKIIILLQGPVVISRDHHDVSGTDSPYRETSNIYDGSAFCAGYRSHDMTKPTKWHVRPAKTQINLGIRPVWSESSLCAQWVAKDPSFLHADSEYSDQTGRMPRLIWFFAGRTLILLVLSCHSSVISYITIKIHKILTPRKITVIILKFEQCGLTIQ